MFVGIYALIVSATGLIVQAADPYFRFLAPQQRMPIRELATWHGAAAVIFLFIGVFVRRRGVRRLMPRVLIACLPVLLLLSADRVLNFFFPPPLPPTMRLGVYRRHPRRGMTLDPETHVKERWGDVYIDAYGLRVRAADWKRALGERVRLLFLGDSITFGYHLPADAGYVEVVQRLLERTGATDVIALNGGTISHTPSQELDWLRHEGASLSPDLVVIQICMNDITFALHPTARASPDALVATVRDWEKPHWSAFMRLAFDWGQTREYGVDLDAAAEVIETENFDILFRGEESESLTAAWRHAIGKWREMLAFCRARDVPVALMIVPLRKQIMNVDMSSDPQDRICQFARENGIPCLDLLPVLRSLHHDSGIPVKDLYLDYTHPTPKGHRVFAEALMTFMQANDLLTRARSHRRTARGE